MSVEMNQLPRVPAVGVSVQNASWLNNLNPV
jgi:hypothetical protein